MGSWSEAYIFGIPKIDEQHKKLFEIYDNINKLKNEDDNNIDILLDELEQYVLFHFKTEEELFNKAEEWLLISRIDIDEHISQHNNMKLKVIEWRKKYNNQEESIQVILDYIKDWLISHIMISDAQFVDRWKKVI